MKHRVTMYSLMDKVREVMKGDNGLTADHIACLSGFTAESQDLNEIPTQRFAIALLADGEAMERGVKISPELIRMLFDLFYRLMCEACGDEVVQWSMLEKIIDRMSEAEEREDMRGDATLN